uniref:Uncharacterized protein n=1 Tax=Oryza brachyantha TaxID=4533 RepID=J3N3R7_ORYBR
MKKTMVLYPGLAVSHFLPMMQLADELLGRGYAVAVALIDPAAHQQGAFTANHDCVVSSKKPAIRFHVLPRPRVERLRRPPPATTTDRGDFSLLGYLDLVKRHNRCLHGFLASMPLRDVHALVVDSLSVDALDVAQGLGVPGYVFHPGNAGAFAIFLQLSLIRREGRPSFRELGDTPLELPGLPSMPASHLWDELLEDPESEVYSAIMALGRKNSQYCSGILVNTFESLEPRVASALRGSRGPDIYRVHMSEYH